MTTDPLAPFLDRLDRLALADLQVFALPEPEADARVAILERVADAVRRDDPRRVEELVEVRRRVRELVLARMSRQSLDVTWAGPSWRSVNGRTRDLVRLVVAIEDSAVADVVADVADPEDLAALREPLEIASSMRGVAPTGGLAVGERGGPLAAVTGVVLFVVTGGLGAIALLAAWLGRRRRSLDSEG